MSDPTTSPDRTTAGQGTTATAGFASSSSPAAAPAAPARRGIDPRGPRFVAGVTAVVLAIALITGNPWVLAVQVVVFAIGSFSGIQRSPYSWFFRTAIKPRLSPPAELEDPAPPRFAQTVGLLVTGIGLVLGLVGVPAAIEVFAALALIAAVLNAAIGLCLGCELYLRLNLARFSRA